MVVLLGNRTSSLHPIILLEEKERKRPVDVMEDGPDFAYFALLYMLFYSATALFFFSTERHYCSLLGSYYLTVVVFIRQEDNDICYGFLALTLCFTLTYLNQSIQLESLSA